jgi:hypothetical protein
LEEGKNLVAVKKMVEWEDYKSTRQQDYKLKPQDFRILEVLRLFCAKMVGNSIHYSVSQDVILNTCLVMVCLK